MASAVNWANNIFPIVCRVTSVQVFGIKILSSHTTSDATLRSRTQPIRSAVDGSVPSDDAL
jgi:hypothetical protein